MQKLIFYGIINDFSVASFIKNLDLIDKANVGVDVLLNSPGGDPITGWGAITEFRNFKGSKKVTVHGNASSSAAYFLLYADNAEAIEQSMFIFHRASRVDKTANEENDAVLSKINADLRQAVEEGLDVEMFEEIAGVDLDRFFDQSRPVVDVLINAEQAKELGLINNVLKLSAKETGQINFDIAAYHANILEEPSKVQIKSEIKSKMTVDEIKRDHPKAYAEIVSSLSATSVAEINTAKDSGVSAGFDAGIQKERDRVTAWQAWGEIAPERVKEGIKGGKSITATDTQELTVLALKGDHIKAVSEVNADPLKVDKVEDEGSELAAFAAEANKILDASNRSFV